MKKLFAILLTLVIAMTAMPAVTQAAEAVEKRTVNVTIQGENEFFVENEALEVSGDLSIRYGYDQNAEVTTLDALIKAHEDGFKYFAKNPQKYLAKGSWGFTTVWGYDTASLGYRVNGIEVWDDSDLLGDGDEISLFFYQDLFGYSDKYCKLDTDITDITAGDEVTFTLTGEGYNEYYEVVNGPVEGIEICLVNNKKPETVLGVTDKDGVVKVTFDKKGTYAVCAKSSDDTYVVMPWTKVTVKGQKQSVKITSKSKTMKAKAAKYAECKTTKLSYKNNKTEVTFKKVSGSKKIDVSKHGKIVVKKGTKKGTYSIKVKATAKATSLYDSASTTKTIKVKVK